MHIAPGTIYGRLTVKSSERVRYKDFCFCVCKCGTEKRIRLDHLRSGGTTSCGCFRSEATSARMPAVHAKNVTHGASGTPAHSIWFGMRQRCNNPRAKFFDYYGGRGISICPRWETFAGFLSDMGQPPHGMTLDRIDTDGKYEASNCRWATRKEQMNNRRCCVLITWHGETLNRRQWSERTGIHYNTIAQRQDRGRSGDSLFEPVKKAKAHIRCSKFGKT